MKMIAWFVKKALFFFVLFPLIGQFPTDYSLYPSWFLYNLTLLYFIYILTEDLVFPLKFDKQLCLPQSLATQRHQMESFLHPEQLHVVSCLKKRSAVGGCASFLP